MTFATLFWNRKLVWKCTWKESTKTSPYFVLIVITLPVSRLIFWNIYVINITSSKGKFQFFFLCEEKACSLGRWHPFYSWNHNFISVTTKPLSIYYAVISREKRLKIRSQETKECMCHEAFILMLFLFSFFRSTEDSMMLNVLLRKLHYISSLNELISQSCDTSFLYWHRQLIPVYFDYLFESKVEAYRLNVSL